MTVNFKTVVNVLSRLLVGVCLLLPQSSNGYDAVERANEYAESEAGTGTRPRFLRADVNHAIMDATQQTNSRSLQAGETYVEFVGSYSYDNTNCGLLTPNAIQTFSFACLDGRMEALYTSELTPNSFSCDQSVGGLECRFIDSPFGGGVLPKGEVQIHFACVSLSSNQQRQKSFSATGLASSNVQASCSPTGNTGHMISLSYYNPASDTLTSDYSNCLVGQPFLIASERHDTKQMLTCADIYMAGYSQGGISTAVTIQEDSTSPFRTVEDTGNHPVDQSVATSEDPNSSGPDPSGATPESLIKDPISLSEKSASSQFGKNALPSLFVCIQVAGLYGVYATWLASI